GVVSRDELLRRCWDGTIVGDDAINRVISQLRRLLERMPAGDLRIETIPKIGYRLQRKRATAPAEATVPPADSTASQAQRPPAATDADLRAHGAARREPARRQVPMRLAGVAGMAFA